MITYNNEGKIRGRKFYWHRDPKIPEFSGKNRKILSRLSPVTENMTAEFSVHVTSVSLVELGAILEALDLPSGHAHHIGHGKPLGLGSVRIEIVENTIAPCKDLYSDPKKRFLKFFETKKEKDCNIFEKAREAFRTWLLESMNGKVYTQLSNIAEFLRITDFENRPENTKTENMSLDKFRCNLVLPDILEVR